MKFFRAIVNHKLSRVQYNVQSLSIKKNWFGVTEGIDTEQTENCSPVWNMPSYPRVLAPNYEHVWKNGDKDPVIRKAGTKSIRVNFTVQPFTSPVTYWIKAGQTPSFLAICSLRFLTDFLLVLGVYTLRTWTCCHEEVCSVDVTTHSVRDYS